MAAGGKILGFTDLLNDYAALAFGNDVIRDICATMSINRSIRRLND